MEPAPSNSSTPLLDNLLKFWDTNPHTKETESSFTEDSLYSEQQKIYVAKLKASQKDGLLEVINCYDLPKIIVLDRSLEDLQYIIQLSDYMSNKVKSIYYFDDFAIKDINHHYVYILNGNKKNANRLKEILSQKITTKGDGSKHSTLWILNDNFNVAENIAGFSIRLFNIQSRHSFVFPISNDLLSMELNQTLASLNDCNFSPLEELVYAINYLQQIYGFIPNIQASGKYSRRVVRSLENLKDQCPFGIIKRLTIIDRTKDLITPCISSLTFEGFITKLFKPAGNIIKVAKGIIAREETPEVKKMIDAFLGSESKPNDAEILITLDDDNPVYAKLKNANIFDLKEIFDTKINTSSDLTRSKSLSTVFLTGNIDQIKEYMEKAKTRLSYTCWSYIYLNLAKFIMEKFKSTEYQQIFNIEQSILNHESEKFEETIGGLQANKFPNNEILRLMALDAQINGPMDSSRYATVRRTSTEAFNRLSKLGMLKKNAFLNKRRHFELIQEERTKPSIANPYAGYIPLSCRKIVNLLQNPLQTHCEGIELICFAGGCTRAEVSAIRLIPNRTIMILTTNRYNNENSFMESLKG